MEKKQFKKIIKQAGYKLKGVYKDDRLIMYIGTSNDNYVKFSGGKDQTPKEIMQEIISYLCKRSLDNLSKINEQLFQEKPNGWKREEQNS